MHYNVLYNKQIYVFGRLYLCVLVLVRMFAFCNEWQHGLMFLL